MAAFSTIALVVESLCPPGIKLHRGNASVEQFRDERQDSLETQVVDLSRHFESNEPNNNFHLLVSYYKLKRAAASVLKVTAVMTPAALNTGDCRIQ
jgi:hypothetical protein